MPSSQMGTDFSQNYQLLITYITSVSCLLFAPLPLKNFPNASRMAIRDAYGMLTGSFRVASKK
ncbi:MAG: hypothetical protein ABFC98_06195 [Candidatus Cloacimonas sp.]